VEIQKLVLAEYFDYVAGTSTGASIATCLLLGMRSSDVLGFYIDSGPLMFSKARLFRRFWYKYDSMPLAKMRRPTSRARVETIVRPSDCAIIPQKTKRANPDSTASNSLRSKLFFV